MPAIVTLDLTGWRPALTPGAQQPAVRALEEGDVLVLPHVNFALSAPERRFLSPAWSDGRAKNISVDNDVLKGARGTEEDRAELAAMITRFAKQAGELVATLFPRYAPYVRHARTSYRPQPAVGRNVSWRKDDSRLHVDAFPSRPNHGQRILRVFSNINPTQDRVWRVGESFESMARNLLNRVPPHRPIVARALAMLAVTKGMRSEYDHLMLSLHDQREGRSRLPARLRAATRQFRTGHYMDLLFRSGDACRDLGQYMLEQTVHLPVSALYDPARSPLAILERLTGHTLVPAR